MYLETGAKRTFACAVDWPGWARRGKDEETAIEALLEYGPRYAAMLRGTRAGFSAPRTATTVKIVERLQGNATTDFGAPDIATSTDADPVDDGELRRFEKILRASWRAFDAAVEGARGTMLATGPRGGGRTLDAIVDHVLDADGAYVAMLGRKAPKGTERERVERTRRAVVDALGSAVRDGVPPSPRGGKRWVPRYFVRRVAWHVLDHTWEIEDRAPAG